MAAAAAAENLDDPLDPNCRELAHKIGRTTAVLASGGLLIVDLLSRRGCHVTIGGDELGRSVNVGDRMTTVSRTEAPSFAFRGFPDTNPSIAAARAAYSRASSVRLKLSCRWKPAISHPIASS